MKNFRKWITSPVVTVLLFAAAAGLLLFSTIGAARASQQIRSETYKGHVELDHIGVSLLEKSAQDEEARIVAYRDYIPNSEDKWDEVKSNKYGTGTGELLQNLLEKNADGSMAEFVPGKTYQEELSVRNTGKINEYVRVTVYKYWTDPEGNKVFTEDNAKGSSTPGLSPDLIRLEWANLDSGDGKGSWIIDPMESTETEERTVLYYNRVLPVGEGADTPPLTSTLTVDRRVADKVTKKTVTDEEAGYKIIRTSYDYDGWQFFIEAQVDAVQEHNAEDAIRSAWGRRVIISEDGSLKLADSE